MSSKEDVLEQVVEDFCLHKGYFVRHNIKYRPSDDARELGKDSNHSDIDILAYNPNGDGNNRVWAISCKSWQSGFVTKKEIENIRLEKKVSGRERWKAFRELVDVKWATAFLAKVLEETGEKSFTYVTAVTKVKGARSDWEDHAPFRSMLGGNPIKILTLQDMIEDIYPDITTTLAATEIGRLLQLIKAANINFPKIDATPTKNARDGWKYFDKE